MQQRRRAHHDAHLVGVQEGARVVDKRGPVRAEERGAGGLQRAAVRGRVGLKVWIAYCRREGGDEHADKYQGNREASAQSIHFRKNVQYLTMIVKNKLSFD